MNRTDTVPTGHATMPRPAASGWAERLFKLREHNTTVRTELVAGLTTDRKSVV